MPDGDGSRGDLSGIDGAASTVQAIAIGTTVVIADGAANVVSLVRCVDIAVGGRNLAGEAVHLADRAAGVGVESHSVGSLGVNSLDNVDLAVVGPIRSQGPERRPSAADGAWHVLQVKNDQARVVSRFALKANARATI